VRVKLERETGSKAPSTKLAVQFIYRLGSSVEAWWAVVDSNHINICRPLMQRHADDSGKPSKRDTGFDGPSAKHRVEFTYRRALDLSRQKRSCGKGKLNDRQPDNEGIGRPYPPLLRVAMTDELLPRHPVMVDVSAIAG